MKSPFPPQRSAKEVYKEHYTASKQGGEYFFPDTLVRDAIVALLLVVVIITLALIFPAHTEPPADPTSTTYNPRPEWYFLFFFQFLKLFPGWLEPVAAVIVPIVALVLLSLVPFLNRGLDRRWSQRKPIVGIGLLALAALVTLEIAGARSAPAKPAGEESRLVQTGRQVYQERNCSYCHSISGVGSSIGPDLKNIGGQLSQQQITTYLENPSVMAPATLHPKFLFTPEELQGLVSYLATLGAPANYSPQAAGLYQQYCSSCHLINGQGGTIGPDLSAVGALRSPTFLEDFITNPKSVLPGATMPSYRNTLTKEQVQDIAAYLYSQKGAAP